MNFESREHLAAWSKRTPAGKRSALAADRASEIDRIWFESNPGVNSYTRVAIKDEFPPIGHPAAFVHVEQLGPGVRMRRALVPMTHGDPPDENSFFVVIPGDFK